MAMELWATGSTRQSAQSDAAEGASKYQAQDFPLNRAAKSMKETT